LESIPVSILLSSHVAVAYQIEIMFQYLCSIDIGRGRKRGKEERKGK
jgi:hypothetical protein